MNKLLALSHMGFKVGWKVIEIGFYGEQYISPQLGREALFEYFDILLETENEQSDIIIKLICESDDIFKFDKMIHSLANDEQSKLQLQLRKWRAYLLNDLIHNLSSDSLGGLIELMEFWVSMDMPDDCPLSFPKYNNPLSIQQYFTPNVYNAQKKKNIEWLQSEVKNIIKEDNYS